MLNEQLHVSIKTNYVYAYLKSILFNSDRQPLIFEAIMTFHLQNVAINYIKVSYTKFDVFLMPFQILIFIF